MNDMRARFNDQVSNLAAPSNNSSAGSSTFYLPPSPRSTDSYHPWTGTGEIDPTLRTMGEFPWHLPGDHGEGYESPLTPSDLASTSGPSDSRRSLQRPSPPPSSVSIPFNRDVSIVTDKNSCTCCGLSHAFSRLCSHIRDSFSTRTHRSTTHRLPNPHLPTDAALLQVHLSSSSNTFAGFMTWLFDSFDICRDNRRVQFPERHHLKLPAKAVALLVAMDLEEGVLYVEGDGEDRDIAWSCAVELRRLTR